MGKIFTLPKHLANQIAAGEVVERPVSVVKELVENSLDAGAKNIKVFLQNGGIDEIQVVDDGGGIDKTDLSVLGEKHSTSKIHSIEDLYNVMTFGFRGEALASISSVSTTQIVSRTADENSGWSVTLEGGERTSPEQISSNIGTKITVKNLFYNTPARLNYLKSANTEKSHIQDFLSQISLAYPSVSFELVHDESRVWYYPAESLQQRIYNVYGAELSENLIPVDFEKSGIHISGFLSHPKIHFKNKQRQSLFVNKRVVKIPLIAKAIADGYNRFIPHGTYPAYILFIEVDPTQVDVNVHPRKQEVRFAAEQDMFRSVYHSIDSTLDNVSLVPNSGFTEASTPPSHTGTFSPQTPKYFSGSGNRFHSYSPYKDTQMNPNQSRISDALDFTQAFLSDTSSGETVQTNLGKLIGQAFNSYIIVEQGETLVIYDQHALAERVNFEKLCNVQVEHFSQKLLIPETLHLTPTEMNVLTENREIFLSMGFECEVFSGNSISIASIPDFVKKERLSEIFTGILHDVGEHHFESSVTLEEVKNKVRAYTACRSAIKFGDVLSEFEMQALLRDAVLDYSATCPHGRPVAFEVDLQKLKGKFDR